MCRVLIVIATRELQFFFFFCFSEQREPCRNQKRTGNTRTNRNQCTCFNSAYSHRLSAAAVELYYFSLLRIRDTSFLYFHLSTDRFLSWRLNITITLQRPNIEFLPQSKDGD